MRKLKVYVYPNTEKNTWYINTLNTCKILSDNGAKVIFNNDLRDQLREFSFSHFADYPECIANCDAVVVIGGDGTILKCAEACATYHKPILGINCGTLGFMASLEYNDIEILPMLINKYYSLTHRMMLEITTEKGTFHALNDVVISKSDDCKIADFEVQKECRDISYLRADGVIFSTATGSTAYSMSAGGPIIEPEMQCIEFTQMCPHSLFARSMILSPTSKITVDLHCKEGTHALVNVDGNIVDTITNGSQVKIKRSDLELDIVDIKGNTFFRSVNDKLMQPLKGKLKEDKK